MPFTSHDRPQEENSKERADCISEDGTGQSKNQWKSKGSSTGNSTLLKDAPSSSKASDHMNQPEVSTYRSNASVPSDTHAEKSSCKVLLPQPPQKSLSKIQAENDAAYEAICEEKSLEFKKNSFTSLRLSKLSINAKVKQYSLVRRLARAVTMHASFELIFGTMICISAILNGISIHLAAISLSAEQPTFLNVGMHVLNGLFTVELSLRIIAQGCSFFTDQDNRGWNWFDLFCVMTVVVELLPLLLDTDIDYSKQATRYRLLKIARLTRFVRILRVSRLLRYLRALRHLVISIGSTLKALHCALVLLFIILYCFAAILTVGATDFRIAFANDPDIADPEVLRLSEVFWGSMSRSVYTLFLAITGGLNWSEIVSPLLEFGEIYAFVFFIYFALCFFAVLNVVTGVFCESAIANAQRDQDAMIHHVEDNQREYAKKLHAIFEECDENGVGEVSLEEFKAKLAHPSTINFFKALEIDVQDAKEFFRFLDQDGAGTIDCQELIVGCMRMKGAAKSMDMMRLLQDTQYLIMGITNIISFLDEHFGVPETEMRPDSTTSRRTNLCRSASAMSSLSAFSRMQFSSGTMTPTGPRNKFA